MKLQVFIHHYASQSHLILFQTGVRHFNLLKSLSMVWYNTSKICQKLIKKPRLTGSLGVILVINDMGQRHRR